MTRTALLAAGFTLSLAACQCDPINPGTAPLVCAQGMCIPQIN